MSEEFITPRPSHSEAKQSMRPEDAPLVTDNTNRNFKGQQKNEVVLSFYRKHWIVLLPYIIGFLAVAAGIIAFFTTSSSEEISKLLGQSSYRILIGIAIVVLTYGLHSFFLRLFNYYLQTLIITNFRVIQLDHTLYFHKDRDSIDLPEIQDIVIHQSGIMKTIFNYGELIITLSSVHSSKTLFYVPNPEYHFRKINKTKREYITSRRENKEKALESLAEATRNM